MAPIITYLAIGIYSGINGLNLAASLSQIGPISGTSVAFMASILAIFILYWTAKASVYHRILAVLFGPFIIPVGLYIIWVWATLIAVWPFVLHSINEGNRAINGQIIC
jgi:hypothetical protein